MSNFLCFIIKFHPEMRTYLYTEYVEFNSMNQMGNIFGTLDTHVKLIEKELSVAIVSRDLNVEIKGEQQTSVKTAVEVFHILKKMQENGEIINDWAIGQAIEAARDGAEKMQSPQ